MVMAARLGRKARERLKATKALPLPRLLVLQKLGVAPVSVPVTKIVHARALSETRESISVEALSMHVATSNGCARSIPRKGGNPKRFHEPMAGVLKSRHVGKGPKLTKARFSAPALAPCTPAQFARLEDAHNVRQLQLGYDVALRQAFRDAEATERASLDALEARRVANEIAYVSSLSAADGLCAFATACSPSK